MERLDVIDADWLKKREASWLVLEEYLSDDYSMREVSVVKDIFFTGKYDLSNPKHKRFFDGAGNVASVFEYYPLKNEVFWRQYVTDILPLHLSMKGEAFNIESVVFALASFDRARGIYGWSVEEEVMAHNFFLGPRYKLGKIKFLDFEFKNPVRPESVVMVCSRNMREWLGFIGTDNKYLYILDYFFDALGCLDGKYYAVEIMSGQDGWPQKILQQLIHAVFNYDRLALVEEYKKANESVVFLDDVIENERRTVYAEMLAGRFSALKKPSELAHLIEVCRKPGFKLQEYRYKPKPVNLP